MSDAVAGIVLAAGRGTRFPGAEPKLLARLAGEPMVRRVTAAALAANLDPILVVVGHRAADIRAALAGLPVRFVENRDYADGLSTSLRAGFAALSPSVKGALVLLGDMPAVDPVVIRAVVDGWVAGGRPDAAVPVHRGRRGNPVLLSIRLAPDIAALTGDTGAGPLLRVRPGVLEVPSACDAVLTDVDTPEALRDPLDQAPASTTPSRMAE